MDLSLYVPAIPGLRWGYAGVTPGLHFRSNSVEICVTPLKLLWANHYDLYMFIKLSLSVGLAVL
jgi:hypothetical protein